VQNWHLKFRSERMMKLEISNLQGRVYFVRGKRVMLDFDLADLYGVETKYLRRSVKRHLDRFEPTPI
jgi:hypothetical protein